MYKSKLISLSGIDGAGKSTQVTLLSEYLKKEGFKVHVTEEMFGYFLFKPIIKYLRSATGSPNGGPVKRNTSSSMAKLWFIPAFIDIWASYVFKIRPKMNNYDYIIADRFYTDIWANLIYYGYAPDWVFDSLINFLPKPTKAFVFSVEPDIVLKRETDFEPSYYKEQAKIYKKLEEKVSCYVINANGEPKEVFKQIKEIVNENN